MTSGILLQPVSLHHILITALEVHIKIIVVVLLLLLLLLLLFFLNSLLSRWPMANKTY